jgi:hypothetical protein
MQIGDEEEAGGVAPATVPAAAANAARFPVKVNPPAPVFHPLAYRGVVAEWPVEWRERWGRSANAFEEKGLSWRDAETQAFVEVWKEMRQQSADQAADAMASSEIETN